MLGFVAIARPTFDIPLAETLTAQARKTLAEAGYDLVAVEKLVMTPDDLDRALADLAANPVDLVIVLQATFADSTMICHLADSLKIPVLLWALPEERTGGRLRLNSFCGINLAAHSLRRAGIRYGYLYAAPDDPAALARIDILSKAAAVQRKLRNARIGRVGENPAGFATCLVNYDGLRDKLGIAIEEIRLAEVFAGAREADPQTVADLRAQIRINGLDQVDRRATDLTLGTYDTLRRFAHARDLQGFAVRCWPEFFTELGCAACGALSMLSDELTPCCCEADVNGTITQLILQWISGEPAFGTDMVDFDVAQDVAIIWHCGLAPLSMADGASPAQATIHSNRKLPLLMEFTLKPGRVTLARLSEATGEFRLVIGSGEMIQAPPSFGGTSGTLRFDSGTERVMKTILDEGLEHHMALTYGDHREVLRALARMLALPVLEL